MATWLERLGNLPKASIFIASVLLLVGIGLLDSWVRVDLGLSLFYIGPIALAVWYVGRRAGLFLCFLAAIVWFWAELFAIDDNGLLIALWNTLVRLGIFLIITFLLTSLKAAYDREYRLARVDGLTGVINWRSFQETLQAELSRRERYQYPITLAYIDIDNFKQVNDSYGHGRGDTLLQEVAYLISHGVRSSDVPGRVGGDEFVIIMPHTNQSQAQQVLPRLHQDLVQMAQTYHLPVGFSIGVVTYEKLLVTSEEMIATADQVMYQAKADGKNQIVYQAF
jgi:diguanylate cyclase (GGDEF)-like protein